MTRSPTLCLFVNMCLCVWMRWRDALARLWSNAFWLLSCNLSLNDLTSKRVNERAQSRKTSITQCFKSDIVTLFKQKNAYFILNIDHYYHHFNATVNTSCEKKKPHTQKNKQGKFLIRFIEYSKSLLLLLFFFPFFIVFDLIIRTALDAASGKSS